MIIFGFRSWVKFLAMLTLVCPRCHNPAAHRLSQRSRWFTLFFIPVIPLGRTRFTTCTFCGLAQKVGKEDADRMVAAANPQQSVSAGAPVPQLPGQPNQPGYPAQYASEPFPQQGGYPQQQGGFPQQQGGYPQQQSGYTQQNPNGWQ